MTQSTVDSPNNHRTMQVVNHVRALIENGTLQPGDKTPLEREHARSLKISHASLRTDIGYLAAIGVMKIRHGVGTFVADGPPDLGKSSLGLIGALHGFQSWQMFATRIFAGPSARANRKKPEDSWSSNCAWPRPNSEWNSHRKKRATDSTQGENLP